MLSTVFIGNYFEQDLIAGNGVRKYYHLGGKRIANGSASGLYFISGDQLGSTSLVTSITGTVVTEFLGQGGIVIIQPAILKLKRGRELRRML